MKKLYQGSSVLKKKEKQSKTPYWVTDCSYDIKFEYSYEKNKNKK